MKPFRILVSDKLSERGLDIFRAAAPDVELVFEPGLGKKPQKLLEMIGGFDALAIRSGTQVTPEVIARAERLKVIGRAGIGVDNVDLKAASRQGIVVMNTPDGNVVTTGEHAVALLCALTRKIPQATASMRAAKWEKARFQGRELFNKTLGVVGLGNIGKIVASRALGLKMRVIASDPFVTPERAHELGVELVDLKTLLKTADAISLHVPLLDSTRDLINADAIATMKSGVLLINAARGGLVDESAVAAAVESGQIGGAAFDVFATEPPAADNPLLGLDNVILTPHLGASTSEAQENVAVSVAGQIIDYLKSGTVVNAVNAPSVPPEVMETIAPYIALGRKLGSIAAQLHDGNVHRIRMIYGGETADQRVGPITVAILGSVLKTHLGKGVNDVNAPLVAKERGLEYVEEKSSTSHDFVASVAVELQGPDSSTRLVGALFGAGEPRIVQVDDLELEIVPKGNLLITRHQDQPGIIGSIGTVLGAGGVNISRMALGVREVSPDLARAVISIDTQAEPEVIDAIRAIDGIDEVRQIRF